MPSNKWLKSLPSPVPLPESEDISIPASNVSMSDVRRIVQRKAAREAKEPLDLVGLSEGSSEILKEIEQLLPSSNNSGDSPPLPTTPHHSPPLPTSVQASVAPARDFNRRANSLEREAMPAGLFPGSSKKIYDALYLRTRGANPPRSSVRAARRDFLDWTDIRNMKTIDGHLRYLMSVGLIVRNWELGSTQGSKYEVRLPEEIRGLPTTPHHSPPVTITPLLGSGDTRFSGTGGQGQPIDSASSSGKDKTSSFNTNTERSDDDEAFAEFAAAMGKAMREITGRETSQAEAHKWRELADVLITEMRIAAARTTVSSAPAFLSEHLRRRLFKKDRRTMNDESNTEGALPQSAISVDASKCPDCGGSSWWYPDGPEKGVARCGHDKLTKQAESAG